MNYRIIITTLICLFITLSSTAINIEDGAVYRIYNVNTQKWMSISSTGAIGADGNENDSKQQWYISANSDNSGYYLRNVSSGAYLTSPLTTYTQWTMTYTTTPDDKTMLMIIEDYNGNITLRAASHSASYSYAHNQSSGSTIVCWTRDGSLSSQWQFVKVNKTQQEIDDILKSFEKISDEISKNDEYQTYLDNLFKDKSCTQLLTGSNLENNSNYTSLPPTLRRMVDKIASDDWAESNIYNNKTAEWNDKYARKYRVQNYEPYSEGSTAAAMAGIQAYTNMNNPTGIVGDAGDLIYVMVETDIPEGSTLYINGAAGVDMYNSTTSGTKLHKGLNTLLCTDDNSHFFVYYTVNTVSIPTGETRYQPKEQYNLKKFAPIKIHIEGGRLNGFFNHIGDALYANDTQQDFEYTVQRATHPMYDFVGKYVILHLHLNDTPSHPGEANQKGVLSALLTNKSVGTDREYDPVKIMKAWDNMCFAERILMGIQSDEDIKSEYNRGFYESITNDGYSFTFNGKTYTGSPNFHYNEYFNNRMMGISQQGDLFMNATSWRTAYNVSTIDAILTLFCAGDIWGPAHEYGHINQGPMNLAGTTEESNNIFSNVALFYTNRSTSRCDFISNQLKLFLRGKTFLEHGTWGTTRMFWQLWCYYHATGHNKKFYPRLYELLRRYPITKTTIPGVHNELYDKLHFAKMCCIAAQEDLTDFFTAWGFFVPLDGYAIDDYSQYNAVLSQKDIDAVKAEIAAYGFPKNDAIILIDDRPGSANPTHSEFNKELAGELGGLQSFNNKDVPSGRYTYMVSGSTIEITKSEDAAIGVGFLVFDEAGNLLAFSNSYSFEVNQEIVEALMSRKAHIVAIGADSNQTTIPVVNTALGGSIEEKIDLLKRIISLYEEEIKIIDETGTKVGYYYESETENLVDYHKEALNLLDSINNSSNASVFEGILTEQIIKMQNYYNALITNARARISVVEGNTYTFTNKNYPTKVLAGNNQTCISAVIDTNMAIPFNQQWIFEAVPGSENEYYIRNAETDLYIGYTSAYNTSIPLTETPQYKYTLIDKGYGVYAVAQNGATGNCLHHAAGGAIVRWSDSAPSLWYITMINTEEYMSSRAELYGLIQDMNALLDKAGKVQDAESRELDYSQVYDKENVIYSNAPYTKLNNNDCFKSWSVLFDTKASGEPNIDTYFHSDYSGDNSADGLDHYIRFYVPNGDESFRHFKFSYTTRNIANTGTNPRAYRIDTSIDGNTWIAVYTKSGASTGQGVTETTSEINAPKGTKYIRFMVTQSGGSAGGHPYFVISDAHIYNRTDEITCIPNNNMYPNLTPATMKNAALKRNDGDEAYHLPSTTIAELQKLIAELRKAYSDLYEQMNSHIGIRNIVDDSTNNNTEYYNLNGIRITNPEHGIFIKRDGNKVSKVPIR